MASSFLMTNGMTLLSLYFVCLILAILITKKKNKRIASKLYFYLILLTLLTMILNLTWGAFAGNNPTLTNIFGKTFSFTVSCWNFLLAIYVTFVFKTDEQSIEFYNKRKGFLIAVTIIFFIVNIAATLLLKFEPYLLEQNIYKIPGYGPYILGGSLATFQSLVGAVALLYAIGTIIFSWKKVDHITRSLCIIAIIISGGSIALKLTKILVQNDTSMLHAIVLMFLFLSMESQDRVLLAEFNESSKKAKESNELKSEFIMNMSHQLRTPMNTILGFSDYLLNADGLTKEMVESDAANIKISSKKLLDLINSILDISKLESQKEVLNNDDYKLDTIIYDVSSHINSQINKENLLFTINANSNCPNDLYGDGFKLCKILNIILSNAVKNTDYGEVSLNVSSSLVDIENHEFTFHIKNSGHTMTTENFDRSFDDLIKLNSDKNNDIDADTLKIIVAKGLLNIMGGTITFINQTGQGTQYIIKVKQKVTTQNELGNIREKIQTRHEITHQILSLLGKKAIIIDDKKVNSVVLKRLLSQYNIGIEIYENPRVAIEKITNETYDVIFTNHDMETMNGKELINKLESTGNKIPPIVALVNNTESKEEISYYNSTLICPIEFRELNKIINKLFKNIN